jgi:hypothetical protein
MKKPATNGGFVDLGKPITVCGLESQYKTLQGTLTPALSQREREVE